MTFVWWVPYASVCVVVNVCVFGFGEAPRSRCANTKGWWLEVMVWGGGHRWVGARWSWVGWWFGGKEVVMDLVFQIRKCEAEYFFSTSFSSNTSMPNFHKVFLGGNSEGGMAAFRYHHSHLEAVPSGRILSAWSCNFNYCVACPENAHTCVERCNKDVPQVNLIGSHDEYFGVVSTSVSSQVVSSGGHSTIPVASAIDAESWFWN